MDTKQLAEQADKRRAVPDMTLVGAGMHSLEEHMQAVALHTEQQVAQEHREEERSERMNELVRPMEAELFPLDKDY